MKIEKILYEYHSLLTAGPEAQRAIRRLLSKGLELAILVVGERTEVQHELAERVFELLPELAEVDQIQVDMKPSKEPSVEFTDALSHAGVNIPNALLVSSDLAHRRAAQGCGLKSVADPVLAEDYLDGGRVHFVVINLSDNDLCRLRDVASSYLVPYYLGRGALMNGEGALVLIGLLSNIGLARLVEHPWTINVLPANPDVDELYLAVDDMIASTEKLNERSVKRRQDIFSKYRVLGRPVPGCQQLLIALRQDQSIDDLHFDSGHGHALLLTPHPYLFEDKPAHYNDAAYVLEIARTRRVCDHWMIWEFWEEAFKLAPCFTMGITVTSIQQDVSRYSGLASIDCQGTVTSRHISHPDNKRVVDALVSDLQAIGLTPVKHAFTYGGNTYHNVIADLPGWGYLRIDPQVLDWVRMMERLQRWPWLVKKLGLPPIDPPWKLKRPLTQSQIEEYEAELLKRVDLEDWGGITLEKLRALPWWPQIARVCGWGAQVVIVGCHLDSTAALSPPYNPSTNPAPGADDDASGIAATLAVARYLASLPTRLTHTVRFAFFNAEEQGMVGSQAYVAERRALGEAIRGAFLIDMIGYNSDAQNIFEAHVGATDQSIRDASLPLASFLSDALSSIHKLGPLQVYKGTAWPPPSQQGNRDDYDPAINRSDHASFHNQGYPAVVVSEDFFANKSGEPGSDPNPNYHQDDDSVIDASYAAKIACSVVLATRELAR